MSTDNVEYGPYELRSYPCAVCGSVARRVVFKKRGIAVPRDFEIVRCNACGHVYVDPRIADEDLASLYDEDYYAGKGFDRTIDYLSTAHAGKDLESISVIDTITDAVGGSLNGVRWLDFGCGTGMLIEKAREYGAEAEGVDESPVAREVCAKKKLPVVDKAELRTLIDSFDVVTALEVIEHVPDPREFLRYLVGFLKVGGVLYVQTGNWNIVRHLPGTPYVMPEGHIRYFTPTMMRRLFREAGLTEVATFNRSWFPYRDAPTPIRSRVPMGIYCAMANLTKRIAPSLAPFPLGRREG